jgi:hypothetical protein
VGGDEAHDGRAHPADLVAQAGGGFRVGRRRIRACGVQLSTPGNGAKAGRS